VKTILVSFILLLSLQSVTAQEYQHKTIAILPFRMTSPEVKYAKATDQEQLSNDEKVFSMNVQQAFYNSITNDKDSWLITVQDCRITDSLLERAGIDLQKAGYMDKEVLAKLLKVDAVMTGQLDRFRTMHNSVGAKMLGTSMLGPYSTGKLFLTLFDGETGELIWTFKRDARTDQLIGNYYRLDPDLYNAFRKKFPYTR
jgi:hypothetical protein